jgi:dihydroflavonol-4-reductase
MPCPSILSAILVHDLPERPAPARILVSGAGGFVGGALVPLLAAEGHAVRAMHRPGSPPGAAGGVEWVAGDLLDQASVLAALRGVDAVVHLAALVSFHAGDAARSFQVNAEGTRRLAAAAREAGVRRFLHVSTVAAVGYSDRPEVLDETAPYNFGKLRIPYCDSKRAAELAVLAEVERGLDAVIVNPSSMFGPGDRRKAEGSLLDAAFRGRILLCPPGGINVADVRDVARGCLQALARGRRGERYILGGENLSGRQLLATVCGALGRRAPRWSLPPAAGRALAAAASAWERLRPLRPPVTAQILRLAPRFMWYSSAKAERELGYRAGPVDAAVRAAYEWMAASGMIDAAALADSTASPAARHGAQGG